MALMIGLLVILWWSGNLPGIAQVFAGISGAGMVQILIVLGIVFLVVTRTSGSGEYRRTWL